MDEKKNFLSRYTLGEEIFNSITHGVGAVLAAAGLGILVVFAALYGDTLSVVSAALYGATLMILYIMSTLYHSFKNPRVKQIFRIFDHCTIFLLIAGTYTPLTLVTLRGPVGYAMFGVVWLAAVVGIVLNAINMERFKKVSLVCYVLMGWVIVFAFRPLLAAMAPTGVVLLLVGGVCYTVGITFYVLKKIRYMHSIWHLFVLAGSILHYLCILLYVIPNQ